MASQAEGQESTKQLCLTELLNVEVASVSRRPQTQVETGGVVSFIDQFWFSVAQLPAKVLERSPA